MDREPRGWQPLNRLSYAFNTFIGTSGSRHRREDESTLAQLGKKQVLKRRFGFPSLFGFSCTILAIWEVALGLFQQAFVNGGPAGLVYGFIIAWLSSLSVYLVIAEMASMAPIAGGQYFWVSMLAPTKYKRFLSYITGWLTSIAWTAVLATASIYASSIIQGMIILDNDEYKPHPWHGTLLCWAVLAVAVFINTVASALLPAIESLILVIHMLGFFAVLIPVVSLSSHGTTTSVFKTVLNEGKWPTQGFSYCVGFIGNVATFAGADAAVHMSEEVEYAAMNIPRAIVTTTILNGAMGFAMVLVICFCLGDLETVLDYKTGFPFEQVIYDSLKSKAGATVLISIPTTLLWCTVISILATASRMTWSFARDRGLPFHRLISKVQTRASIPVAAILLITTVPMLLALIYIGSSTVFNDVVSLSTSGLYASYFMACSLLLWRRITGQIAMPTKDSDTSDPEKTLANVSGSVPMAMDGHKEPDGSIAPVADEDEVVNHKLVWGPWRLPGWFGVANNIYACVYCLFVLFWSFWPPEYPATPENMNYSVLMTGAALIFSVVYYHVWGKKQYLGPLVDREVKALAAS